MGFYRFLLFELFFVLINRIAFESCKKRLLKPDDISTLNTRYLYILELIKTLKLSIRTNIKWVFVGGKVFKKIRFSVGSMRYSRPLYSITIFYRPN